MLYTSVKDINVQEFACVHDCVSVYLYLFIHKHKQLSISNPELLGYCLHALSMQAAGS